MESTPDPGGTSPPWKDCPAGCPAWVTPEMIDLTIRTWQPYYDSPLTPADALGMILNVGQLWAALQRRGKS